MKHVDGLRIVVFRPADQVAVRALILDGLAERFGGVADPALNPDLDDIAASYRAGTTLVAWLGDELVGTGTVVPRAPGVEEIVRMSVASAARGQRLATRLLDGLVDAAVTRAARRIVCETCAHWDSAVRLYLSYGFAVTHQVDGAFGRDTHFALDLRP